MRFTVVQLKAFFSHNLKLYKWYLLRKVHWYKNAVVILTKYGYYFTVVTAILLGCSNWAHFVCSTVILKTKTTIMLAKLARLFTHLLQNKCSFSNFNRTFKVLVFKGKLTLHRCWLLALIHKFIQNLLGLGIWLVGICWCRRVN